MKAIPGSIAKINQRVGYQRVAAVSQSVLEVI